MGSGLSDLGLADPAMWEATWWVQDAAGWPTSMRGVGGRTGAINGWEERGPVAVWDGTVCKRLQLGDPDTPALLGELLMVVSCYPDPHSAW